MTRRFQPCARNRAQRWLRLATVSVWSLLVSGAVDSAIASDDDPRPRVIELAIGGVTSFYSGSARTGVDEGDDAAGSGGSAMVSYLWKGSSGATGLYAGAAVTDVDDDECPPGFDCDMSARVLMVGGMIRVDLPVSYASPSLTVGLGLTAGRMNTVPTGIPVLVYESPFSSREVVIGSRETELRGHLRVGFGLALGCERRHRITLEILQHEGSEHALGVLAFAVGFAR